MSNRNINVRNVFKYMYIFFFCFILMKPTPTNLLGNVLALKLFDAIALIMVLTILLFTLSNSSKFQLYYGYFNNKSLILLLFFAIFTCVSQFVASILIGQITVANDLFELYRYFYYLLVFFLAYISGSIIHSKDIETLFIIAGGGVIFIAVLQYFNPLGIQAVLSYIYTEEKLRGLGANNPRVFGSMYNANWFGLFAAIWTSYIFYHLQKSKMRDGVLWLSLLLYGFFGIYISGSRTGLVLMVVGIMITILYSLYKQFKLKKAIISFVIAFGAYGFIPLIREKSGRFNELFESLSSGGLSDINSFEERFNTLNNSIEYALINPWSGIGYGNYYDLLPHNSYLLLFIQFGFIGFMIISIYFAMNIIAITRKFMKSNKCNENIFMLALLSAIIFNVGMLSGEYINSIQLMSIYMLIIGYSLGLNTYNRDKEYMDRRNF